MPLSMCRLAKSQDIGCPHHLKHGIQPLPSFGFGLSYTQIELMSSQITSGHFDVMLGFDADNLLRSTVIELEAMTLGV